MSDVVGDLTLADQDINTTDNIRNEIQYLHDFHDHAFIKCNSLSSQASLG